MKYDVLPPEFSAISHLLNYVVKRTHEEWSSSCPKCGGSIHVNGEPPDRFRMWVVSRYGKPMGWCRNCNYVWTQESGRKPTIEEIKYWQQEQIKIEQERKDNAEKALSLLNGDRLWEKFYEGNNDWSKQVFHEWGISDSWIDYLQLGLMPDYLVKHGDEQYHSPAATIPVWKVGGIVQNIKLRILNPHCGGDRYRNFYAMGESFLFVPMYDLPLSGAGVVVEGEKKAIVLEQTLDNPNLRVVGIQSKTPSPAIFENMKYLDPVYVFLDPDAKEKENKSKESAVEYVTRLIGKERARIVDCPVKVDDGILQGLDPKSYLRMAKKA